MTQFSSHVNRISRVGAVSQSLSLSIFDAITHHMLQMVSVSKFPHIFIFLNQIHQGPIRIIIYNTKYDVYVFMRSDGVCCVLGLCGFPEQMAMWAAAKWEISYKVYMPT